MKKSLKISTIITLLVTVAYALYLLAFDLKIGLPVEKSADILKGYGLKVPLTFELSCWWNLWISPLVVVLLAYCYNQNLIVGKEPRDPRYQGEAQIKHMTKLVVYIITIVSTIVALGTMTIHAILFPFWSEVAGPLSSLLICGYIWIVCYFVFGFAMEFLRFLTIKSSFDVNYYADDDKSSTKTYQENMLAFLKQGMIKTFPFMFGLTCGYMCRGFIVKIFGLFKSVFGVFKNVRISIEKN